MGGGKKVEVQCTFDGIDLEIVTTPCNAVVSIP